MCVVGKSGSQYMHRLAMQPVQPRIQVYLFRSSTTSLRHSANATDQSSEGLRPRETFRVSCAVGELISSTVCGFIPPMDGRESVAESRLAIDCIFSRACRLGLHLTMMRWYDTTKQASTELGVLPHRCSMHAENCSAGYTMSGAVLSMCVHETAVDDQKGVSQHRYACCVWLLCALMCCTGLIMQCYRLFCTLSVKKIQHSQSHTAQPAHPNVRPSPRQLTHGNVPLDTHAGQTHHRFETGSTNGCQSMTDAPVDKGGVHRWGGTHVCCRGVLHSTAQLG